MAGIRRNPLPSATHALREKVDAIPKNNKGNIINDRSLFFFSFPFIKIVEIKNISVEENDLRKYWDLLHLR